MLRNAIKHKYGWNKTVFALQTWLRTIPHPPEYLQKQTSHRGFSENVKMYEMLNVK